MRQSWVEKCLEEINGIMWFIEGGVVGSLRSVMSFNEGGGVAQSIILWFEDLSLNFLPLIILIVRGMM
jgi:hypothetical protein